MIGDNKMENKQINVKKEYVRPNVIVRDVYIKGRLLGVSGTIISDQNPGACEIWTDNMKDVLGEGPGFHNGFTVNNDGFNNDLTGL